MKRKMQGGVGYQHKVLKYVPPKKGEDRGSFDEFISRSTDFFSLGYQFDGSTEEDHIEVDTLEDLWHVFVNERDGDRSIGAESKWHYRFYRHLIVEENGKLTDNITPLAVFKKGEQIFAVPILS